ncbi:Zinc/iron permease [Cutaneotrichosporon oleaginosum]|uniref:Zinc/iron permease n=2 Tax=Cutaneotrichosporon oleaginosum TaxID=879819 RepID=A0A0J0XDV4_9TREE|nr:Zinc/iron permease [Cutaneotrichosporon oleaginosum]KLT39266.1 Zinc/iron permease [Cutaneotrichosporon oleaginosum]
MSFVLGEFNMPMHVASIFIVLVISALGVYLPTIAGWFVKDSNGAKSVGHLDAASFGREYGFWRNVFFLVRHFGTGVIISTAFVHLLYHGFLMWNDRCLGTLLFAPVAPTIAMVGALITFALDFVASHAAEKRFGVGGLNSPSPVSVTPDHHSVADTHSHAEKATTSHAHDGCCPDPEAAILAWQNKELWRVLLLEAGIIFHSVMIGVTLGADSSSSWTTLFIVIIFHQFFEGAALGARLALLHWLSKTHSFLQASMFMIVTPIGIAIGIGVRKSFSANGTAALISIGVLDSTSAGILLYTSFKLLAADYVDGPLKNANKKRLFASFFCLFLGILAMTILGRWV